MLSTYLFITIGLLTLALAADDAIKATAPSNGRYLETPLHMDMTIKLGTGNADSLYRIDTAHPYAVFSNPRTQIPNVNLFPDLAPHEHTFSYLPENYHVDGTLVNGAVIVDQIPLLIGIKNGLFSNATSPPAGESRDGYIMFRDDKGIIPVFPTDYPPTDGTILTEVDWNWKNLQSRSVHIFAKRSTDATTSDFGVLRFGGPKPYDHTSLNITGNEQCHTVVAIGHQPDQEVMSYRYSIEVNMILHNGLTIDGIPPAPQGYQVDTLYPFIQVVDDQALRQLMGNFTPAATINSDGMAQVDCTAKFAGLTAVRINETPFDINPVDMVVNNPFRDGRCFSAYQPQRNPGFYKIGWPFLYNVGITWHFDENYHNITSRPYY